jgi:hypothetical protein
LQIKKTKTQKKEKIMKFKDYVESACIDYVKISRKLGISISAYYGLVNGTVDPRASLIHKIDVFSNGAVKYKDWLENHKKKRKTNEDENNDNAQTPLSASIGFDNRS